LLCVGAQRGAAARDQAQSGEVVVVDRGVPGERHDDRRRNDRGAHAVALDRAQALLEVDAGHGDERGPARQAGDHQHGHAHDVKEGRDRERDIVVAGVERGALMRVGDQVAMREHHALGQARRAAGVRHRRQILGRVDVNRRRRLGRAQQIVVLDGATDGLGEYDEPDAGSAGGSHLVEALGGGDHDAGPRVRRLRRDLTAGVRRVQRCARRAGPRRREEHDRVLGQIRENDRDHVTLAIPSSAKPPARRSTSAHSSP
jgi:hypothetical protein